MSRKSQALDAVVRVAVDAACRKLGVHGVCPIAQELVAMAVRRAREPSDEGSPRPGVGSGDRAKRPARPEERRDRISQLVPEEQVFKFPDVLPPIHIPAMRRAIIRGMAAHVTATGAPVGAGGRVVKSIVSRIGMAPDPKREHKGGRPGQGFEPGSDPP